MTWVPCYLCPGSLVSCLRTTPPDGTILEHGVENGCKDAPAGSCPQEWAALGRAAGSVLEVPVQAGTNSPTLLVCYVLYLVQQV